MTCLQSKKPNTAIYILITRKPNDEAVAIVKRKVAEIVTIKIVLILEVPRTTTYSLCRSTVTNTGKLSSFLM